MKNTILAEAVVNAQAQVVAALLKNGWIDFRSGTQPDGPEDAITDQVLLVGSRFSDFSDALDGVIFGFPIDDAVCVADGVATWARLFRADHITPVMDVSVGTRDADVILTSTKIRRGALLQFTSFQHEVPRSTPGI